MAQLGVPSSAANTAEPRFSTLMAERLYYAEGRHHPQHPRHGSQAGLGHW
ncbi:MAG: hypothetical protein VKK03_00820 [Synechococcus sp.]|nr:hypothetical protein [Synechococcus sp.]